MTGSVHECVFAGSLGHEEEKEEGFGWCFYGGDVDVWAGTRAVRVP